MDIVTTSGRAIDRRDPLTPSARGAVAKAVSHPDGGIVLSRLLDAMIDQRDGLAGALLRRHGLVDERRAHASDAPGSRPETRIDGNALVTEAVAAASELGHPIVGTEHLLLVLARSNTPEGDRLRRHGLDTESIPMMLAGYEGRG